MALEDLTGSSVFISNLVPANPPQTDPAEQGALHIQGIKNVLVNSFPNINGQVTATDENLNLLTGLSTLPSVPVGTILDFAGLAVNVPAGFLACPAVETNVSRTTYANLFAAIGTLWGAGDGSTTFGLPYFAQGEVGLAGAGTATPGTATVGQNLAHTHSYVQVGVGSGPGWTANGLNQTSQTGSSGGSKNLAAGRYIAKIIKY